VTTFIKTVLTVEMHSESNENKFFKHVGNNESQERFTQTALIAAYYELLANNVGFTGLGYFTISYSFVGSVSFN